MKMSLLFGPVVAEPICRSLPLILHSVFNQSYHKIESDNERTTSNLERIKSEVVSCWKTVFHRIIEISVSDMVRTASDMDISESDMDREVSELHSCINDISSCSCITRYLLTCYNPNLSILTDIKHQLSLAESTLRVVSPHMLKLVRKALGKSSKNDSFNAMRTLMKFKISLNIVKIEIMEIQILCLRETEIMTVGNPAFMRDIYLDDATNLFPKIHDLILIPNLRRCSRFVIILFKSYPDLPESLGVTVLAKKHNTMHEKVYSEQRTTLLKVERKNIQFCLFLHDSCFQEITKDIACYTGIEEKSSLCKLSQKYFDLLNEAVNVVRKNEVGSSFEKMSLNQRESNRKQIESLVRDFFKNEKKLDSDNPVHDKNHVLKRGVSGKEDHSEDDQQEPQGLLDVIPEIFAHVEIRPLEIVAFPATQQRVLEPFLNKFTSPESTPSKHDTMAVEFLRLCTMHDYPSTNGPSLLRLAENGFYYDGNGTELICFSCGVKIRNWKYDDIPSEIHQKMSANCRFLMESGDGNIPVPRMDIHEELASSGQPAQVISGVEADGPRTAAAEPPNNTAVLTSADSAQGHSKTPPRVMVIKHPEYADRSKRLASYKTFPRHMKQHPADMTDAGFYYAGFGDCCRCYHCGVGLRNWDPEDNPWIEHARWSADCPYIFEMKGQAFIDLVQEAARAAEMADDDNENEDDARSTEEKSAPFPASSTAANDSAQISQTPTELSSNSIENNVVKTSEATISQGTPVDKAPVAVMPDPKIIKAPLRSPAAQTLVHEEKIKPRFVMEAIDELVKKEGWTAFNIENIRKYLKIQEDGRKSAHSASAADPNVLKQENKELKDLTICKICLDEKVSIVFLPCGHLVSCPQCAPALTKCPICRKVIKGTVRTNLVEKNHGIAKKS